MNKDDQAKTLFFDKLVYTKNRNFRLFKSTKLGKDRPFLLSELLETKFESERDLFMACLICNVPQCQYLTMVDVQVSPTKASPQKQR
jgi:hypothetical protein